MKKALVLIFSLCMACSGVTIKGVTKAEDFSISKYKTFSFYEVMNDGNAIGPNYAANLKLLKEAIAKEMSAKGVSMVADNPDLLVNIGIALAEKVQTRETSLSNPADRTAYMGQRNYHWESQEVAVGKYREGTVIVHLVERAKNNLVWQGRAESVVPEKQKNVESVIKEAMTMLFEKIK
jgi:hypothetical protein